MGRGIRDWQLPSEFGFLNIITLYFLLPTSYSLLPSTDKACLVSSYYMRTHECPLLLPTYS